MNLFLWEYWSWSIWKLFIHKTLLKTLPVPKRASDTKNENLEKMSKWIMNISRALNQKCHFLYEIYNYLLMKCNFGATNIHIYECWQPTTSKVSTGLSLQIPNQYPNSIPTLEILYRNWLGGCHPLMNWMNCKQYNYRTLLVWWTYIFIVHWAKIMSETDLL